MSEMKRVVMRDERQALLQFELRGNEAEATVRGNSKVVEDILAEGLVKLIRKEPQLRRTVNRAMRRVWRETRHELISYWLDGWPFTLLGAGILFGIVYGFSAFMHWIGGAVC